MSGPNGDSMGVETTIVPEASRKRMTGEERVGSISPSRLTNSPVCDPDKASATLTGVGAGSGAEPIFCVFSIRISAVPVRYWVWPVIRMTSPRRKRPSGKLLLLPISETPPLIDRVRSIQADFQALKRPGGRPADKTFFDELSGQP